MNPDTTKQIIDAIRPLAEKLGQGTGHLYEVFVRQQFVDAVGYAIWAVILLLVGVFLIWILLRFREEVEDVSMIAGILGVCLLVGSVFAGQAAIKRMINPEYYAIQAILCAAKGACEK